MKDDELKAMLHAALPPDPVVEAADVARVTALATARPQQRESRRHPGLWGRLEGWLGLALPGPALVSPVAALAVCLMVGTAVGALQPRMTADMLTAEDLLARDLAVLDPDAAAWLEGDL